MRSLGFRDLLVLCFLLELSLLVVDGAQETQGLAPNLHPTVQILCPCMLDHKNPLSVTNSFLVPKHK